MGISSDQGIGEAFTPSYPDYSNEELLEQAQANAQAALIATVAFLQERSVPVAEWATALGRLFAIEWADTESWVADEFLDAMLSNYRALGARVISAELRADESEALIAGFPDAEQCSRFGVEVEAVALFHDSAAPIASSCGLVWSWELLDPHSGRTRLRVMVDTSSTAG